jgi:hypothetical protein
MYLLPIVSPLKSTNLKPVCFLAHDHNNKNAINIEDHFMPFSAPITMILGLLTTFFTKRPFISSASYLTMEEVWVRPFKPYLDTKTFA